MPGQQVRHGPRNLVHILPCWTVFGTRWRVDVRQLSPRRILVGCKHGMLPLCSRAVLDETGCASVLSLRGGDVS